MTFVLDEWWKVALFVALCITTIFVIARNLWLSIQPPKRADRPPTEVRE